MKSKLMVIVLVISLAINIGIVSVVVHKHFARRGFLGGGPAFFARRAPGPMFSKMLDLTKEQKDKIGIFQEETHKYTSPLMKNLQEKRKKLFEMVKSGKVDQKKKQELLKEISELQVQIESVTVDSIVKMRGAMTEEQLKKMDKLQGRFEKKFLSPDTFTFFHDRKMRRYK